MRRMLLAGLLVIGLSWTTSSALAGTAQGRIIGGTTAAEGSWPAIAVVATDQTPPNPLAQLCGGTLIDPSWVLTAAHCTFSGPLDVIVGVTDLTASPNAQARNVDRVERYPGYVNDGLFRNDVALLHLDAPVTLNTWVQTMDLVSPIDAVSWDAGSDAKTAGWGRTNLINPDPDLDVPVLPDVLQVLDLPILADSGCASYGAGFVPTQMTCAGFPAGGQDTCSGDSGGPLVVADSLSLERRLVGAVSWGQDCALPNFPGVYAKLPNYRTFIYNTIGVATSGAPLNAQAVHSGGSATVAWQPPSVPGGRPLTGYEVRALLSGVVVAKATTPPGVQTTTLTGLAVGARHEFEVSAANAAGFGAPATAIQSPIATGVPSVQGIARVGHTLTANTATWLPTVIVLRVQWQSCDATQLACADIPGATGLSYSPTPGNVGKPLKVVVTGTNALGSTSVASTPSAPVRAAFAITRTRGSIVTQRRDGTSIVSLGLRTDPQTRFTIRVLDQNGKPVRPVRTLSRFDGKVPGLTANNRLVGTLAARETHTVLVAVPGRARGTLRTIRFVITSIGPEGDRLESTFRARVRR